MVGPIGSITGLFGSGGGPSQSSDDSPFPALVDSGTLRALDFGRDRADRIKAELGRLRDALKAARANAESVPGATRLTPIIADIEQTVSRPNFILVNGQPVEDGTITVSLGTRPVIVGYEAGSRPSLAVRDAVAALSTSVSQFVATVGGGTAAEFAAGVATLLKSGDLGTAVNAPDAASLDAAIGEINTVLAKADSMRASVASRASAAAQIDLSGVLLSAAATSMTK